jgi:hypothetical protein
MSSKSRVLVIGDIHQNHQRANQYINNWDGQIVFLGDYFDQFHDSPEDARATAEWLKDSLQHSNRIHLMGNHDFHYMLPVGSGVFCSGYSPEKHKVVSEVLSMEDWNKVKYFHAENNCWFSHAGVSYKWFSHPVLGINKEVVEQVITKAKEDIAAQIYNTSNVGALWAADHYRGGRYDKGGLLWCDWRILDFFEDIVQVVGHTPRDEVKSHSRKGGLNINIDTHLKECIILDTLSNQYEVVTA